MAVNEVARLLGYHPDGTSVRPVVVGKSEAEEQRAAEAEPPGSFGSPDSALNDFNTRYYEGCEKA